MLGLSILFEGLAAIGSAWLAVGVIEHGSVLLTIAASLAWGLVTIASERRIAISLPPRPRPSRMPAVRLLSLAVTLATLTSIPLFLQITRPAIATPLALIRSQRLTAFLAAEKKSQVGQLITAWGKDVSSLEIVQSLGGKPFDPSADPDLRTLTRERATELTAEQGYYEQWQCQLYGGQGCPARADGPFAQASHRSYEQALKQVADLTSQIKLRYNQLSRARPRSTGGKPSNVAPELSKAKLKLRSAERRELRQVANFKAASDRGINIRLAALVQALRSNPWLGTAFFFVLGLMIMILSLPALLRINLPAGDYEVLLSVDKGSAPGSAGIAGHAFISYVREDKDEVDRLQRALEAAGIPVWRDIRELLPGQDWQQAIRRAISEDALAFIACFSQASVAKPRSYQNDEILLAISQFRQFTPGKLWLIPVRFDRCKIPDFEVGEVKTSPLSSVPTCSVVPAQTTLPS